MKIVGVGLNKTGTTTLATCFKYWGFRHISVDKKAFELYQKGDYESLLMIVNRYDTFKDWPWALIYREIDVRFPGTKVILTTRKNPDIWFHSLCKHAVRTGPTEYRRHIYGYAMPQGHASEHIAIYERHNEAVREYFRNRPDDFLEVCWEKGDGWHSLAKFLGLGIPDIPFPHVNKSST